MSLEDTMLSEMKQSQKDKYCIILLYKAHNSSQIHKKIEQNGVFQRLREDGNEVIVHWVYKQYLSFIDINENIFI